MKKQRFGKAFTDELEKVRFKYNHFDLKKGGIDWQENLLNPERDTLDTSMLNPWRRLFFPILILVSFAILFTRLFHLQVALGKDNRELADSNRIQIRLIHAPRGVIYDRHGRILAQNDPGFRLVENHEGQTPKITHLSRDEALKMEVDADPGYQNLEIDSNRAYPLAEATAHVLGYVGEITEEELKEPDYKNYNPGDRVGRGGVEEAYEKVLRGVDGGEIIEVDAKGEKMRILRTIDPIPGQNVYLALDATLQSTTYQKLQEGVKKVNSCCGAVVIQDPNSGEILALASYPSFDPKDLTKSLTASNSPLLNRAIAGEYPPGSTFKIASALAALASGKVTPQTTYEDTGVLRLGPYSFANWYFTQYGKTEGHVDMVKALKRSNDIYFYQLGQTLGEKTLGDFSKQLGLGKDLGIDIPGESNGLIPNNDWKEKNYGQSWYPGDTLHMAIGQGFVLATPLQINNLISLVAASGKQYPPHLALKITSPDGSVIKQFKYQGSGISFKQEDINIVKKGLSEVPISGGTAWPFFNFPIQTAGKTGTAEFGDPKDNTHAWYTSYAPMNNPQLASTVLVEGGGEGSNTSAPIAKEIYRWYFSPDKSNLLKDVAPISTESAKTLGE